MSDHQEMLLIYLKDRFYECGDPLEPIQILFDESQPSDFKSCLENDYEKLSPEEKIQLITEYSIWANKNMLLLGSKHKRYLCDFMDTKNG